MDYFVERFELDYKMVEDKHTKTATKKNLSKNEETSEIKRREVGKHVTRIISKHQTSKMLKALADAEIK